MTDDLTDRLRNHHIGLTDQAADEIDWLRAQMIEQAGSFTAHLFECHDPSLKATIAAAVGLLDLLLYAWRTPDAGGVGYEDLANVRAALTGGES